MTPPHTFGDFLLVTLPTILTSDVYVVNRFLTKGAILQELFFNLQTSAHTNTIQVERCSLFVLISNYSGAVPTRKSLCTLKRFIAT